MKVSDYIANYLYDRGIKVVFGYQGGMVTHIIDSIGQHSMLEYIQCYHEQTASIAAEGYSLETGNIGCAISSSGPGVTNMMTGIADAYFDSIPVLYISGQVNTYEYKYDKPIRQQGFQEMEVAELVKPITKYSTMVDKEENIPYELEKAISIALSGRKGPVLLDIPLNVQRAQINPEKCKHFVAEEGFLVCPDLTEVKTLLSKAKRPMLLLGAGALQNGAPELIEEFLERYPFGVVTSLRGRGSLNESYRYYMGMVGSYGNRCADMSISKADLLIVLGSRLDTRQTGARLDAFLPNAHIVHVNDDINELNCHRLGNRVKVNCYVRDFLYTILKEPVSCANLEQWHKFLAVIRGKYNQDQEIERLVDNKSPYRFIQALNKITQENDILVSDIGQNQMWTAQTAKLKKGMKHITSGGLAPMGFSMPAAIGISYAAPQKTVYAICGDGAFHMSSQAVGVIAQHKLPIKIIIMNNDCLGMINQFQRLYFDSRFYGTHPTCGYQNPCYEDFAKAYGVQYFKLTEADLVNESLLKQIAETRTCVVECIITGFTSVCPKLEYDKPISKPMPMLDEEEFNKIMSSYNV